MNLIKPKLVDHSLIKYPQKKPTIIQKKIVKQDNNKFCTECGFKNDIKFKYCISCGVSLA